jgi:hypothetical protein
MKAPAQRAEPIPLAARLRNPAILCLAAAVIGSGALVVALAGDVIFLRDEWAVVLYRRGFSPGVFLDPHAGHLAASVVVFYKLLLAAFGMTSPLPFHIGATVAYLLAAVLLFAYARRRVGDWLALMAAVLILFFGAASVDLLSPFQIFFSGGIAAGLGALLALDRDDRAGDVVACLLLIVSITFSEVGIAFSLGALVRVALGERAPRARLYVPLLPLVLYGLWWLGWGHSGESYFSLHNVAMTPSYVLDAVSAALSSLLGIASASDALPSPVGQQWWPVVTILVIALAIWRVRRLGGIPRGVWVVLTVGLTFWVLAGFNYFPGRAAGNGRYLYPSAVFVLLIWIELLRGVRLGAGWLLVGAAITAVGVAGNLQFLKDGYRFYFEPGNEQERGAVSALDIAGRVNPSFDLNAQVSPVTFYDIRTRAYLSAVSSWGSPGYTDSELAQAPEQSRLEADKVLGAMLGIRLEPGGATRAPCRRLRATQDEWTQMPLGPGQATLDGARDAHANVAMGRFSDELPVALGALRPGSRSSIEIPADASDRPWRLGVQGAGVVRVCGNALRAGGPG